jgi:hypothetical protein
MKLRRLIWVGVCLTFLFTQAAFADHVTTVYGNSAGTDGIRILSVDVDTGTVTLLDHITSGAGANQVSGGGNGRGVVVVGNTIYYTWADSGNVYSYNLATHTNNGLLFSVAGTTGLATAAWDGSHIILGDYSGTNKAFFYTLGGTLTSTVTLNSCTSFCDGLEFANGGLISNRADLDNPIYDKYAIGGGAATTPAFINMGIHNPSGAGTGIAYDGTYYFVSDPLDNLLGVFDGTGAFVKNIALGANAVSLFEDLSVDYNQVIGTVPEPSSVLLLLTVMAAVAFRLRKRVV